MQPNVLKHHGKFTWNHFKQQYSFHEKNLLFPNNIAENRKFQLNIYFVEMFKIGFWQLVFLNSRKFITENVEFHLENSLNETTHMNRIANHDSNSEQSIMNTLNELLLFEILHQCGNTRYAGLIHQNKSIQIFTQYAKHCKMCFKFMSLKRI